ncbi:hypothetical protein [Sphingomonas sp. URHD0057]|uniref:hypothetical protein n=1 Tax=Sphingomonas sp. URHD0057 TaxID=1380389 RepID=UPI000490E1E9|nr:hypothetical protein [Sphingomonas sp. URHD0057]
MKRDIADDAVALVEDREDGDALRHRGHARDRRGARPRPLCPGLILLLAAAAACRERERNQQRCGGCSHAYSGIHGS